MEDALKKLDKLTQEEARMATAEVLRTTHATDKRVLAVDDRVARVGDRVASVDDKVAEVINGTQISFSQAREMFNLNCSGGKEANQVIKEINQVIKQTANDVDQVKRS